MKEKFNKFDIDNNGFLSKKELELLIKENLREYYSKAKAKGVKEVENVNETVENLAQEIIDELDVAKDGSKNNLSWNEFKHFMERCMTFLENLTFFLNQKY